MKIKKSILAFAIFAALTSASCIDEQAQKKQEQNATIKRSKETLEVALESNIQYRQLDASCGFFSDDLTAKFILIPLRKDVIKSVVAYKASLEDLDKNEESQLLRRTENEFLNRRGTFIVAIINNSTLKAGKNYIYFDNILNNVFLTNELSEKYKIAKYTHNLRGNLNPGINIGYIHFENFRHGHDGFTDTYTLEFNNFNMVCDHGEIITAEWSFLFEDSEVPFLALIEKGWSTKDIRKRYIPNTYESIGLKATDILTLIKFIATLIK